jgi:hypothetical protein
VSKSVDALALSLSFDCEPFMQFGRDTQVEFALLLEKGEVDGTLALLQIGLQLHDYLRAR